MDRGTWWAIIHRIAKSDQLTHTHTHTQIIVVFQSLSPVPLFVTLWTQHSRLSCPSFNISWNLLKLKSTELMMPSNHLISVTTFSSCLQSFPALWTFPMSHLFPSGGQSVGASVSVFPLTIQGLFPLGLTVLIC